VRNAYTHEAELGNAVEFMFIRYGRTTRMALPSRLTFEPAPRERGPEVAVVRFLFEQLMGAEDEIIVVRRLFSGEIVSLGFWGSGQIWTLHASGMSPVKQRQISFQIGSWLLRGLD
jgi:hypothetical protein